MEMSRKLIHRVKLVCVGQTDDMMSPDDAALPIVVLLS